MATTFSQPGADGKVNSLAQIPSWFASQRYPHSLHKRFPTSEAVVRMARFLGFVREEMDLLTIFRLISPESTSSSQTCLHTGNGSAVGPQPVVSSTQNPEQIATLSWYSADQVRSFSTGNHPGWRGLRWRADLAVNLTFAVAHD